VKTLRTAYRVTDLAASLGFYTVLGYGEVGRVDLDDGACLVMLKFPGEEVSTLAIAQLRDVPAGWIEEGEGTR
jgi:lactoylglutathione lyase